MNPRERGFALLSSHLGVPGRRPLTAPQLRVLAQRVAEMGRLDPDRDLTADDLAALGYGREMAERVVSLLDDEDVLDHFLHLSFLRNNCKGFKSELGFDIVLCFNGLSLNDINEDKKQTEENAHDAEAADDGQTDAQP